MNRQFEKNSVCNTFTLIGTCVQRFQELKTIEKKDFKFYDFQLEVHYCNKIHLFTIRAYDHTSTKTDKSFDDFYRDVTGCQMIVEGHLSQVVNPNGELGQMLLIADCINCVAKEFENVNLIIGEE